jgi:hypothetical protein
MCSVKRLCPAASLAKDRSGTYRLGLIGMFYLPFHPFLPPVIWGVDVMAGTATDILRL